MNIKIITMLACCTLVLGCVASAGMAMPGIGFMIAMKHAQESLPEGFHREDEALVYRGGVDPVVLSRTTLFLSKLPVSSFEIDATGGLKSFTISGVDTSMFSVGVTVRVSSVTFASDGRLLGMTFDNEDTGCDMTVTFEENGNIRIVCAKTSCATVCDAKMTGEGQVTVTCECRATPSP